MKITIEHYGQILSKEWEGDGVLLPDVIQSFCHLLFSAGYSKEGIAELFVPEGSKEDNDPFKWSVG